jgi:hypothetical protein
MKSSMSVENKINKQIFSVEFYALENRIKGSDWQYDTFKCPCLCWEFSKQWTALFTW